MDKPIPSPRVNPVGVLEVPDGFAAPLRRHGLAVRLAVWAVLVLFAAVTVVTSALSLGAYCLTSDGADGRDLRASPAWRQLADRPVDAEP